MAKTYLGMDCGTQFIKGVVIDDNKNILAQAISPQGASIAEACKGVLAQLNAQAGTDVAAAGTTGLNKPMLTTLFDPVVQLNDAPAQAAGAAALCPDAKTVIVVGSKFAHLIHLNDGELGDYELGCMFDIGTGRFLEQKAGEMGISVDSYAEIALSSTKPALLPARGTTPTADDFRRLGYTDADILMGYCKAIASRFVKNVIKKQPYGEPIVLQGGLANNAAVVEAMQTKLKTTCTIPANPEYTGAVGAAVSALQSGEEKPVSLADAAASPITSRDVICANCTNMCTVTGAFDGDKRLIHWGNKCDRIDPLSIF